MQIKPRFPALLCALCLLFTLSACQPQSPSLPPDEPSENATPPTESTEPPAVCTEDLFRAILLEQAEFFSTDAGKSLTLNTLNEAVSPDPSVTVQTNKFTVLDLDHDGTDELLLQMDVNNGVETMTEILRLQDDVVYSYTLWARSFSDLKADGTFSFSSGAGDTGFGSISFTETGYIVERTTYNESDADGNLTYFVDQKTADNEQFYEVIWQQIEKPNAFWYYLTEANVNALLSPDGKIWSDEIGSVDHQIKLIADCADDWYSLGIDWPIYGGCGYAVTDLDHNGRLELIGAYTMGTGHYTTAFFHEVDETYTQLVPCPYLERLETTDPLPDILYGPESSYYSADTDTTYYVYEDFGKLSHGSYPNVMAALWLKNGEVHTLTLAIQYVSLTTNGVLDYISITDWTGAAITEAEYADIGDRYFSGHQKLSSTIGWLSMTPDEMQSTDLSARELLLFNSYQGFTTKETS